MRELHVPIDNIGNWIINNLAASALETVQIALKGNEANPSEAQVVNVLKKYFGNIINNLMVAHRKAKVVPQTPRQAPYLPGRPAICISTRW